MTEFNLSEYLTQFQVTDKSSFPPVDNATKNLNMIIDKLAVSPEDLDLNSDIFDSLIDMCQGFNYLLPNLQQQLTFLISSSLINLVENIITSLSINNSEIISLIPQWKSLLEKYGYLSHVLLYFLQENISSIANSSSTSLNIKSKKKNNDTSIESLKRNFSQVEQLFESVIKILEIPLSKIFQTTPTRDRFIGLFIRPIYMLLETEQILKLSSLKFFIIKIISISVKNHNQSSNVQNAILSNLTYFPHLTTFNADLLKVITTEFDYPQLTEDILRDISNKEFNSKDLTGPKAVSNFLIKLSELIPKVVLRQMPLIIRLLNNSSFTLRCSVVEACSNIIIDISRNEEDLTFYKSQIDILLELLEKRFCDSNPYVRSKAIQGCWKIIELPKVKFHKNRQQLTNLAVQSLQDKSSLVRRNAVKLLSKLILTHPFNALHGTQLKLSDWVDRVDYAKKQLKSMLDSNIEFEKESLNDIIERSLIQDDNSEDEVISEHQIPEVEIFPSNNERPNVPTEHMQDIQKMKLTIRYYEEAVNFIQIIHHGIELACQLLFSKNRNEVLETMDFFVLTDAYSIELAYMGIKRMLHLVWMKGANDDGTGIASHLVECYQSLFLTIPSHFNYKEKATLIATNLINLTLDASIADLASLEKLLGMLYENSLIDGNVIVILWDIYNSVLKESESNNFTTNQIHGSIIVLGMLSLVDHEISLKGVDSLLNVGLGEAGRKDLILSKFSCIALQRIVSADSKKLFQAVNPREQEIIATLESNILEYTTDPNFYPVCEQAINAIFNISHKPDLVCTEIIKKKTIMTFGPRENDIPTEELSFRSKSLTQLLFIVGHVAIKTIVYLEKYEAEFKKRKIEVETTTGVKKYANGTYKNNKYTDAYVGGNHDDHIMQDDEQQKELEIIGGSNEDEFTDAIIFIKENELLFGENSLLAKFGPLVEEIVSNTGKFEDDMLQRTAVLCLEKLMCVSSRYCEKNLPLLITIMEKSPDPIIRSNAILGLGDMAVCFNNLVDENTDFLYRRLNDENLMVQKTCLMTITFLILAGQVKVKGQLGQMAKCLENPDQDISDMCKLFFTELAGKDNAIYNGFIDMFSCLSNDSELERDSFNRIIKFLLLFIDKERHQKQLSEKLLTRLSKTENQKQWDNIAFVLNSLPYKSENLASSLEKLKPVNTKK